MIEEDEPEAHAAAATAPAQPQQPPLTEINFRNGVAVRTALLTAVVGSMLWMLPIGPQAVWLLISLLLVGFLAVFFYQRRTGQVLNVVSGARLGWITGVFSFVIALVLFTAMILAISDPQGLAAMQKEMRTQMGSSADVDRMFEVMREPGMMSVAIVTVLVTLFVMFTVFPTLGAVIGAKVLEKDRA